MELVCAGLVDPHDSVPISMNLEKLLDAQVTAQVTAPPKAVTFHLVSIHSTVKSQILGKYFVKDYTFISCCLGH